MYVINFTILNRYIHILINDLIKDVTFISRVLSKHLLDGHLTYEISHQVRLRKSTLEMLNQILRLHKLH